MIYTAHNVHELLSEDKFYVFTGLTKLTYALSREDADKYLKALHSSARGRIVPDAKNAQRLWNIV